MILASSLTGQPARAEQLAGFNQVFARLQAAVSRKAHYIESDPQWFEHTHHRVEDTVPVEEDDPVDLIPLPPSLRVRVENEEVFEQYDVDSVEDISPTARIEELQRLIVHKDINHDFGNLDSAYVSGSDFSTDVHTDIIDKPRLNSEVNRRKAAREDSAFHDDVIGVH